MVSLWHVAVPAIIGFLVLRHAAATRTARYLGAMMLAVVVAILFRPVMAWQVHGLEGMTYAAKIELYGAIVSIPYLIVLFGIGAGIFFQVMSNLAAGYRNASITDSLTGLLNRRGFLEAVERTRTDPAALLMIDIDRFKAINDTFGHARGDAVIAAVARIIERAAPEPHICGRLGGEEFAVFLQHAEPVAAEALAQSMRVTIEIELARLLPGGHAVTASFGVAKVAGEGLDPALSAADHALYEAKRAGRNRVCVAGRPDTDRRHFVADGA